VKGRRAPQRSLADAAFETAADALAVARTYLASEDGRRLRRQIATAVIVAAPLVSELPVVRRSRVARIMGIAAVGTILVKGAEWLRDWEPGMAFPDFTAR
jgi:hypothetical protein